ncbi:DUF7119 family protein [Haladaptatus sp. ZSTT2]|uniref:DUF7119 family protein n=1 Tax=Haladaptatus sp. ZSTT2 TaxID=3120515 RepID=UPI00300E851A
MREPRRRDEIGAGRESPVGEPVIRGDPSVTGERAQEAARFDPNDPESLAAAAQTVRDFANNTIGDEDYVYMLEGAAACAALVRGEGSYKAAAARADGGVTVSFIRKWARVHDLPRAIRRHVAQGEIAPTAAKHIARVRGESRFLLAWAVLDNDLTVRQVRATASAINNGESIEAALAEQGVHPGEVTLSLPMDAYRELRRKASNQGVEPGDIVAEALDTVWGDE